MFASRSKPYVTIKSPRETASGNSQEKIPKIPSHIQALSSPQIQAVGDTEAEPWTENPLTNNANPPQSADTAGKSGDLLVFPDGVGRGMNENGLQLL